MLDSSLKRKHIGGGGESAAPVGGDDDHAPAKKVKQDDQRRTTVRSTPSPEQPSSGDNQSCVDQLVAKETPITY